MPQLPKQTRAAVGPAMFSRLVIGCLNRRAGTRAIGNQESFLRGGQGATGAGKFAEPRGVACGGEGRLFAFDKSCRGQRFGDDGKLEVRRLPECRMGFPSGVGVEPSERTLLADTQYVRARTTTGFPFDLSRRGTRNEQR